MRILETDRVGVRVRVRSLGEDVGDGQGAGRRKVVMGIGHSSAAGLELLRGCWGGHPVGTGGELQRQECIGAVPSVCTVDS